MALDKSLTCSSHSGRDHVTRWEQAGTPPHSWQIGRIRPLNPFQGYQCCLTTVDTSSGNCQLFPATPLWPLKLICVLNNGLILQWSLPRSLLVQFSKVVRSRNTGILRNGSFLLDHFLGNDQDKVGESYRAL